MKDHCTRTYRKRHRLTALEFFSHETLTTLCLVSYVAWRPGTSNRVVTPARQAGNRFLLFKYLQIRAMILHSIRQPHSISHDS
jgi:hypothetical protein